MQECCSDIVVVTPFTYIAFDNIVCIIHDVSGQAEITDLGHPSIGEEHIPCGQVSVNALDGTDGQQTKLQDPFICLPDCFKVQPRSEGAILTDFLALG